MMQTERLRHGNKQQPFLAARWKWFIAGLVLVYVMVFMPTPYVIFTPGSAEDIQPLVKVGGGRDAAAEKEGGQFMLTTVRSTNANLALLAWKAFDANAEFGHKEKSRHGQTEQEYVTMQAFHMIASQLHAVLAVYHERQIPYQLEAQGLYVIANHPQFAINELQPNDRIIEMNGVKVNALADLVQMLQGHKAGATLYGKVQRGRDTKIVQVTLVELGGDQTSGANRIGLATYFGEKRSVIPTDPHQAVIFNTNGIGGPSAGLMFALELINQLSPGDLTRGHRIAGTGTIDPHGNVRPIGKVAHKMVAADRERAELFLVPEENYEEARAKLVKMNTKMRLASVRNLRNALQVMNRLESVKEMPRDNVHARGREEDRPLSAK